jgi:hypothetical protein
MIRRPLCKPFRGVWLVLGGLIVASTAGATRLSSIRWDDVTESTAPPPRKHHTMVYDSDRKQLLLWGGEFGSTLWSADTVWSFDPAGLHWTSHHTTGTSPAARHGHDAVYLGGQNQMLIAFGSLTSVDDVNAQASNTVNDVWALNDTSFAWSAVSVSGTAPCPRWHMGAALIGSTGTTSNTYFFGGRSKVCDVHGCIVEAVNDTWKLNQAGSSWSWVIEDNSTNCQGFAVGDNIPDRRYKHTLSFVPNNNSPPGDLFSYGGIYAPDDASNNVFRTSLNSSYDVTWTSGAFSIVTGDNCLARAEHTTTYDPVGNRLVTFGGFAVDDQSVVVEGPPTNKLNSMAVTSTCTSNSCWTCLAPDGGPPPARQGHSAVYDPVGDRMIVFGGKGSSDELRNDTWILSFSGVTDLAVASHTSSTVTLAWTFEGHSGTLLPGSNWYEVRSSSSPITSVADYENASAVSVTSMTESIVSGNIHFTAVCGGITPTNVFRYYAVRAKADSRRYGFASNNACFKMSPFTECDPGGGQLVQTLEPQDRSALALTIANPASATIRCSFSTPGGEPATLEVIDLAGRRVEHHDLGPARVGSGTWSLGAERPLTPGYYMVVLRQGISRVEKPVIVMR